MNHITFKRELITLFLSLAIFACNDPRNVETITIIETAGEAADPNPDDGPECSRNSDCRSGDVCLDAQCVAEDQTECRLSSDCGAGNMCLNGECVEAAPDVECISDQDCNSEEACAGGVCIYVGEPEPAPNPDDGDFLIRWDNPSDDYHRQIRDALQGTGYFEVLADALNDVFILPNDIPITHTECRAVNAFYNPNDRSISMCYEMYDHILNTFYNAGWEVDNNTINAYAFNSWIFILFHEMGHALVHNYGLPITGREEDAVDDFSTILLVENGLIDVAVSAALFWRLIENGAHSQMDLADEHSLNGQRLYNILCIVYGGDPSSQVQILESFPEMEQRAQRCAYEYQQKSNSWQRLLGPWIKQ